MQKKQIVKSSLGCSSAVQCSPKMFKALESTSDTIEKNEKTIKTTQK